MMEFTTGIGWIRQPIWAAGLLLGSVLAAPAQTTPAAQRSTLLDSTLLGSTAQSSATQRATDEDSADEGSADEGLATQHPADEPGGVEAAAADDADLLKGIDIDKLDWSQLAFDPLTLLDGPAAKKQAASSAAGDGGLKWSSNAQANGTSAVAVKQPVAPFWDTRVGADMTVAREPTTMSEFLSEKAANGGNVPQSSGSAWAAATAPGAGPVWDKTEVEARVDPGQDQSKVGATLTKSVPMKNYSVTLQNGYNVTEQGITPIPGVAGQATSYGTNQSAKVTVGETGTSLTAGQSRSSTDDKWQRQIGAEQKVFENVTVSGTVGSNRSVTAGYKKSW